MADELNTQNTETIIPAGGDPPVKEPVKEPTEDPGASAATTAPEVDEGPKLPDTVPYERFKEKNDEAKFYRQLLLNREQQQSMGQQTQPVAPATQEPAFVPPPEPNPKEFTDDYGEEDPVKKAQAYGRWEAQKTIAEYEHKQTLSKSQDAQNATTARARQFVTRVSSKFQDFQENIQISGNPSDDVAAAIIAMDDQDPEAAEKVAYHLATNPLEMRRLNGLPALQATIAVGRLAQKVSLPPVKPKVVSAAPAPPEPVKGTQTEKNVDPKKMSIADYARTQHPVGSQMPWLK